LRESLKAKRQNLPQRCSGSQEGDVHGFNCENEMGNETIIPNNLANCNRPV
jgi:hypothetical protein